MLNKKIKKMKTLKYIFSFAILTTIAVCCKKNTNEDIAFASSINTPSKLKLLFDITQNNSGIVTITPNGEGVASFDIYFGDGTTKPATVYAGNSVKHTYAEGLFKVKVVGRSVTGQTAEATQDLTVSFKAPENLVITATQDAANKFKINVEATALYETMFKVYFGDVPNEVPLVFLEGDKIGHIYAASGTYTIKVVALSGGAATSEDSVKVTIAPAPKKQIDLPVTFDDPTFNYTMTDFGNNVTVDAPDPTNAANNVKRTTKPNGAETWAGTTIGTPLGFYSRVPLTAANSKMTVRVYSPAAGLKIRLKMEDYTRPTNSVETEVLSTVANAWETLTFDFTKPTNPPTATLNPSFSFNMASIFFDFGTMGNGKVFYWDDVKYLGNVVAPIIVNLPIDFQMTPTNYVFTDFAGGNVTVVNNPFATGTNTSSSVAKMIKFNDQTYGGSFISLTNTINFAAAVNKKIKMKVYSPRIGAKVLFKVENQTNAAVSFEKEVSTTVANAWEELTFDYSTIDVSKTYQKVILIFDNGTKGDGSANFTFYFDDILLD